MIKKILVIVSFILFTYSFFACVKGAGEMEEAGGLFPLVYNFIAGESDVAHAVAVDSLNNIIVVGLDRAVDAGQWRIMKFDSDGNEYSPPYWPYIVNPTSGWDEPLSVAVDSLNNIIAVGREHPSGSFARWRIVKLNENGGLSWEKSLEWPGETDLPQNVAVDKSDNSIIVVGYDEELGVGNWRVIKYNAAGGEIFNERYPDSGTDVAYGVAVQSDRSIIVVGSDKSATTKNDWRIKKLNPDTGVADINCDKIILSTPESDVPLDVAVDSNDNIIVVGYESVTSSDTKWKIIKLDSNCDEIPGGSWDGDWSTSHDSALSVAVDSLNNIIAVGYDRNPGTDMKWRIMKFGSSLPLTVLWQDPVNPTIPGAGESDLERANSVAVLDGGGSSNGADIVVVGSDDSPAVDRERKWRIMKYRANEDCYNGEDDDLDGCTDCEDYNCPGDSRQECPPDASCGTCYHLECNYLGAYDWSCQYDDQGTPCSDLNECCPAGFGCVPTDDGRQAYCDPVTDGLAHFYPLNDYDRCNGAGVCEPYSCDKLDSYCTDFNQFDEVDSFMCGDVCDYETDCSQSTWDCDTTQRKYGTRDQYGTCDSVCTCQEEPFTYGLQDDDNYCNNCAHCGDGFCQSDAVNPICGEVADPPTDPNYCPADCGGCTGPEDCNDGNECTTDVCLDPGTPTSTCDYLPVSDGTLCTGTPGVCCSGQCDNDGITTGSDFHVDCRTGPQCIASANWGYAAANQGLDCDAPIPYCYYAYECDSRERYRYCDTGYCNGEWGTDQESTVFACNGLDCGDWIPYCYYAYECDSRAHKYFCTAEGVAGCNGEWGTDQESTANACNGLDCGDWIPYCYNQQECDSRDHMHFCTAEGVAGCNGEWGTEQDPIGTACQGLDCGTCCICGSNEDPTADLSGLQDADCDGNDAVEIATCTNTPDDSYGKTWDYRAAFDSQCLDVGSCSVVNPEVENTCNDADLFDSVVFDDPDDGINGCEAECDEKADCPGGAAYGICGPADRPTECVCAHCHFCAGSPGSAGGEDSCYLESDGTPYTFPGVLDEITVSTFYDYEYFRYKSYGYTSMEITLTANNGGNYQVCGVSDPRTCPTTTDFCVNAGDILLLEDLPLGETDPFWLLVNRIDTSGNPGYTIEVITGVVLPNPNTCDETDNRKYEQRGKVYGYKAWIEYEYWDACQDGRRLNETYCDGSTPRSEIYDCKNLGSNYRCSLGECISAKEEKKPKKLDLLDVLTQTLRGIFGLDKWF